MTSPPTTSAPQLPPVLPPLPWPRQVQLGLTDLAVDFRYRRRNPALRKRPSLRALDPRLHRPVFVIGAPRSGTTFLGDCIGMMPEVSYHFEPRLTKAAIGHVYDGSWTPRRGALVFRLTYTALLLAALHGGRRFSDKTPENSFLVPFLAELFPAAQFVHIIRDGRDAAVSHAEKPWLTAAAAQGTRRGAAGQFRGPYPRWWVEEDRRAEFAAVPDIVRTAWCWRRFTQVALDGLATLDSGRSIQLRYESVVAEPMAAAGLLGDFLDASAAGRQALRDGLAGARPSSVGRWRKTLSEQEIAEVEREIGLLLKQLGYTGRAGSGRVVQ